MELELLRTYLSEKKGSTEEFPFGPDALVVKVLGKIYAIIGWQHSPLRLSLKCRPDHALALRAMHPAVQPGYHLNKEHWNTVTLDDTIPRDAVLEMIDHSYDIVVQGLKKSDRIRLENMDQNQRLP
ncbi:MAG: MmcQ/YjbR family DNA-binding protein [Candidatus Zhuqueibacterota bacterium]